MRVKNIGWKIIVFLVFISLLLSFIRYKEIEGTVIEKYSNIFGYKICIYNSYEKSCYSIIKSDWEKIMIGEDIFIKCSPLRCSFENTIMDVDLLSKRKNR
jgi:hypothetical protein